MSLKPQQSKIPWLPDFSDPVRIFTVIMMAEMMVFMYSLNFISFDFAYLNRFAMLSLLAQIIAINSIVLLYHLRDFLNRFDVKIGLVLVLGINVLMAVIYTKLMTWLDGRLFLGLLDQTYLSSVKITFATSLALLTLLRYFYVQSQWEHQIEALASAQMNALQARIKPHFLYNSLNSIASLTAFDQPAAERALINLSGLFRKAFADNKEGMTTIAKELEWVEEYLAIEKLRLMDRLQFHKDIDDDLLEQKIPLLTVQPLIENAVIHGVQHLTEGGLIQLKIKKQNQGFFVEVSNPVNAKRQKPGTQVGLANIKERLKLTYGDKFNMTINTSDGFVVRWGVEK